MMMQSAHQDILEATADTAESKAKLVEELQSRGRGAVGAKAWMDAKLLYEKALTLAEDSSKVAVLNSNLSLVLKNMGSFEEARKAAAAATEADPKYVKGWWRLGQALQQLHQPEDALAAMTKAKVLEPTNKALIKEHQKLKQKVQEEAKLKKEAEAAAAAAKENEPEDPMLEDFPEKTTISSTPTKSANNNNNKKVAKTFSGSTKPLEDDEDDEKLFTKSDAVRGYKVVNGKKTSYFHNELSEEAKQLIGDIAPKRLDAPSPSNAPQRLDSGSSNGGTKGASVWNQAGTWEEKDVTKWAEDSLRKQILRTTYTLPESSPVPGALVTVTKVKKLDGHASFALARGKKRYIYEFMVKLEWKFCGSTDPSSSEPDLECSGSLALPDIDGTIDLGEGYEMHEFSIESVSDNNVRPLLERFVQRGGFHEALNESIDDWVRQFKKEY